jgi:hypothetical protein
MQLQMYCLFDHFVKPQVIANLGKPQNDEEEVLLASIWNNIIQ